MTAALSSTLPVASPTPFFVTADKMTGRAVGNIADSTRVAAADTCFLVASCGRASVHALAAFLPSPALSDGDVGSVLPRLFCR